MLEATSRILYVRAALKPFARSIQAAGGVVEFLRQSIAFDEIFAPHFYGARPFWRARPPGPRTTNSGALGKAIAKLPGAFVSAHPTHAFVGVGPRVNEVLARHAPSTSCFWPVAEAAARDDFSMLLVGCVDESPGFSTVHAVQEQLGLTRRHLVRLLMRWDLEEDGKRRSVTAREIPGCSLSFGKFYPAYERSGNLVQGEMQGQRFLFVPSARKAMAVEREILERTPRFVDCGRPLCETCRVRTY